MIPQVIWYEQALLDFSYFKLPSPYSLVHFGLVWKTHSHLSLQNSALNHVITCTNFFIDLFRTTEFVLEKSRSN